MSTKAPRKYLDTDRTEINPDWLVWRDEATEEALDQAVRFGHDPAVYFPEHYDKAIPEEGAWILVIEEPYTELRSRFRVPLLSMWRARPHTMNSGGIKAGPGKGSTILRPKQAVIATPGGDLHLWPHEYVVVSDPYALVACEGAEMHALGGQPVLDEEQMFYLRSRGIPYSEAVLLLIEQVAGSDFAYVTFPEEVTAILEGVGRPLWRHAQLHPREKPMSVKVSG